MDDSRSPQDAVMTRRRLLQALATVGVTGPFALELVAQSQGKINADVLRQAQAVLGEDFSAERIAVIERALQRNLDTFQIVRDLVIDDRVEPAPVFRANLHAGPTLGPGERK